MSVEENVMTIRRAMQAVNDRDLSTVEELFTPGFVRHDLPSVANGQQGPEAFACLMELLYTALPDLRLDLQEVYATEDRAAVYFDACGTHQGELLGVPPTGRRICFSGVDLYRFEGTKIAETWPMPDLAAIIRDVRG